LFLECDELWSFVGKKRRQKWIWLAINRDTREIVGVAIGARTKATARRLWASLAAVYRQCAVCYTDFCPGVRCHPAVETTPSRRERDWPNQSHRASGNTLRQRCSRLVRRTLSFSKKLANHIGAIWYFVHDYNAQQRMKRGMVVVTS
jgi:insertion element IS1 protein InsB